MRKVFNCFSESPLLKYTFLIFAFLTFLGCSNDDGAGDIIPEEEEPVENGPEIIYDDYLVAHYELDGNVEDASPNQFDASLVGEFNPVDGMVGTAIFLNEVDGVNECGKAGGSFVALPDIGEIWEDGFSVTAWTMFKENRKFERIIDIGNGWGEDGGLPITLSRNDTLNDLVLTSWIDSNPVTNRQKGRLIAEDVIKNGELQFFAATISPSGEMKIYVDGELVAKKGDGHAIMNVARSENFIGHSNYCEEDNDFRGVMDEVRLYKINLSAEEINKIYEIR